MTISELAQKKPAIEKLAGTSWGDGPLTLQILGIMRDFNARLEDFRALIDLAQKDVQKAGPDDKQEFAERWNKEIEEAGKADSGWKPTRQFPGLKLAEKLTASDLFALAELGLVDEKS